MALRDWNNDGQKDFTDNFIEYHIFQNMAKGFEKQNNDYSQNIKKSDLPIGLIFKVLLKAAAVIWSLVLVTYLIDFLIDIFS